MATRLYINRDWYIDWLTNNLTPKGSWDIDDGYKGWISPYKEHTSLSSVVQYKYPDTVPSKCKMMLTASPRLEAQTISGTFNIGLLMFEQDPTYDCKPRIHIWVTVGDTDVVRGTLLTYTSPTELDLSYRGESFPTAQTLTPVNALSGDRIVVEIGILQGTINTVYSALLSYGANINKGDITPGGTDGTLNSWIEFSADIAFKPRPVNDDCSGAIDITSIPFTQTIDTQDAYTDFPNNPVASASGWGDDTLGVWWKYTATSTDGVRFHTDGSAYPTMVSIWQGTCASLSEVDSKENPTAADPLLLVPVIGTTYYILIQRAVYPEDAEDAITGPGGTLVISALSATIAPHNCLIATPITTLPFTLTGFDTTGLTDDITPDVPCLGSTIPRHTKWFTYTPTTTHRFYIDTNGSNYINAIAIYTGSCPGGPWASEYCRYTGSLTTYPKLSVLLNAGTQYWIMIAAADNAGGLLNVLAGDTHDLGLTEPGRKGAAGIYSNEDYYSANDTLGFFIFLDRYSGFFLKIDLNHVASSTGGAGHPAYALEVIHANDSFPPANTTVEGHSGNIDRVVVGYTGYFHIRFQCSEYDPISDTIYQNGWLEMKWEHSDLGVVDGTGVYRLDNIYLCAQAPWKGIMWSPGRKSEKLYVRDIDEYNLTFDPNASHQLYFADWNATPATPETMYDDNGGYWARWLVSTLGSNEQVPSQKIYPMISLDGHPTNIPDWGPSPGVALAFYMYARLDLGESSETPDNSGGIYKVIPRKRNDTLWNETDTTMNVKIPNPFIYTGYIGD